MNAALVFFTGMGFLILLHIVWKHQERVERLERIMRRRMIEENRGE